MNRDIFEQMLSRYPMDSVDARRNATYEVLQQVVLSGLYRGGFFSEAAFYGGTCLRIFHGLERFSEDMDFTLLRKDLSFSMEKYFPAIMDECRLLGREVEITLKNKQSFGQVESAFLKDNTDVYDLSFRTEKSIKVKIEVDTQPPLEFDTEERLLLQPFSFMTRCLTLPNLFAGKMHALVFRTWKNRVKGRDWYDFEWYVRNSVPLNFHHLQVRIREFNGRELGKKQFAELLKEKLASADMTQVKSDVKPFLKNAHDIDIWSNDYFLQLADMIRYD
ncbi:MAG: nucleotidyl transferase AbiEii/AbiGii toxin family protein [Bacteroidales bacterium]|nr:nucleotidyl transferase AbiEii/AbiGii toxin family protein [Bacteroidales bacterium]